MFALTSGSAADTRLLTKIASYSVGVQSVEMGHKPQLKTAARLYQQLMYQYKDNLSASLILGGHDEIEGHCLY